MCASLLAGILSIAAGPATALASSPPGSGVPHGPGLSMLLSPPRLIIPASSVDRTQRLEIENRGSAP